MGGRAVAVLAVVVAVLGSGLLTAPRAAAQTPRDALQRRVLAELDGFTRWLDAHDVDGYVGEVGWPAGADAARWNALAGAWYRKAAAAGLSASTWATGEFWGTGYKLAPYLASNWEWTGVDTARPQAAVVEAQPAALRSVNVAGAEFAAPSVEPNSTFSNRRPGVVDRDYQYAGPKTFRYLASRGIRTVRLPIRWERLQPALRAPLDAAELGRVRDTVAAARAAGVGVILDVHNYGAYYLDDGTRGVRQPIGSAAVSRAAFADLWTRISQAFATDAGVVGYGLMNEPVALPGGARAWEATSQQALDAIRARGDDTLVLVPGYDWSSVARWAQTHPASWIRDPADRFRYEGHHYFDRDASGTYRARYAAEVSHAAVRRDGRVTAASVGAVTSDSGREAPRRRLTAPSGGAAVARRG